MTQPVFETVDFIDWGRVVKINGTPMPETFRARISWDDEPLVLVLDVVHDGGRGWLLHSVQLTSRTGTLQGVDTWRLASTDRLLAILLAKVEVAFASTKPIRRRKEIDYAQVAQIYNSTKKAPAKAVAEALGKSAATATRWIQEARQKRPDLFESRDES